MAGERKVIGQFIKLRSAHPDTPDDTFAPGENINPVKDFLESDIVKNLTPDLPGPLSTPAKIPLMKAPTLSKPAGVPFQPAPPITPTHLAGPQPSQSPGSPSVLPPPPAFVPGQPSVLPAPPNFNPLANANLPAPSPFAPNPNAVLPPSPAFAPEPIDAVPGPPVVHNIPTHRAPRQPSQDPSQYDAQGAGAYIPKRDQTGPAFRSEHKYDPDILAGGTIRIADTMQVLSRLDTKLNDFLKKLGLDQHAAFVKSPVNTQGDLAIDPVLYARHVARLASHLGAGGLGIFAGQQLALFSMNRRGRIWNPALAAPPPIAINVIPPALDLPQRETMGHPNRDIHLEMAKGTYSTDAIRPLPPFYERQDGIGAGTGAGGAAGGFLGAVKAVAQAVGLVGQGNLVGAPSQNSSIVDNPAKVAGPLVPAGLADRNIYNPDVPYDENAAFGHKQMVDDAVNKGPDVVKADLKKNWQSLWSAGTTKLNGSNAMEQKPAPGRSKISVKDDPLVRSAFTNGVIPVRFKADNKYGFTTFKEGQAPKVDDDEAYVPLSFTDLRPIGNTYRTVYFRPMITSLAESFAPEWNKAGYFGRTDPVATYMSTGRSISLGFNIVAFSPEDVKVIYQKLNWLASMVYPEYDKDLIFSSGPVVRMRVGDVINAAGPEGGRGLPGIIESLEFDYNEALWELKKDMKVPRNIAVSLSFTVLHDGPIGRGEEGRFGLIGKFVQGKYQVPGSGDKKAAGDDHLDFPEIDGINSFRQVGGKDADKDFNKYKDLASADEDK